jgi:hypothetical protein
MRVNVQAAINAGLFVQFVYDKWNSVSQTTDLNGQSVLTSAGNPIIPGKSYKVLQTIYANDLATMINPARPQLEGYKTLGIVAVNEADPSDVYLAVRGTENIWEWLQDFNFLQRPFPNVSGSGLTEDGFTDMYLSFSLTPAAGAGSFVKNVVNLLPSNAMLTVTGHSLGAAIATLLALDLSVNSSLPIGLYTLASPRVGDLTFSHLFNHVVPNAYRIDNRFDVVPKTPPPLFYFHVGDETELLPSSTMKLELTCEHDLSSYLNMLATSIHQQAAYPIPLVCLKAAAVASHPTEL